MNSKRFLACIGLVFFLPILLIACQKNEAVTLPTLVQLPTTTATFVPSTVASTTPSLDTNLLSTNTATSDATSIVALDCDEAANAFDGWLDRIYADAGLEENPLLQSDPTWSNIYNEFTTYVLIYLTTCADNINLDYVYNSPETDYLIDDITVIITPRDINLDGTIEALLGMRVGNYAGQGFLTMLYRTENRWVSFDLNTFIDEESGMDIVPSSSVYVYPVADTQGRTYMGIPTDAFGSNPSIGVDNRAYVGGMVVIRWHSWTPEIALLLGQGCFGEWEINDEGLLSISTTGAFPGQGCTTNVGGTIQIPDAQMPQIKH